VNGRPGEIRATIPAQQKVVPFLLDQRQFAIPALRIRDLLAPQPITRVGPGPEIAGLVNVRGRIVTAIDVRVRLGLRPIADANVAYGIVVDHAGKQYSLLVDRIANAIALPVSSREQNAPVLERTLRDMTASVHSVGGCMLVVLDLDRLLES
jgi:purine-binding chemotaxis protein CheW